MLHIGAAGGKRCWLKGEKWIESVSFSRKIDNFLSFHGGKWKISVLAVYSASTTLNSVIRLITQRITITFKDNWELRRHENGRFEETAICFSHSREVSDTAMKASYLIAHKITSASKPYSDGEFVKMLFIGKEGWSGPPEVKLGCRWPLKYCVRVSINLYYSVSTVMKQQISLVKQKSMPLINHKQITI